MTVLTDEGAIDLEAVLTYEQIARATAVTLAGNVPGTDADDVAFLAEYILGGSDEGEITLIVDAEGLYGLPEGARLEDAEGDIWEVVADSTFEDGVGITIRTIEGIPNPGGSIFQLWEVDSDYFPMTVVGAEPTVDLRDAFILDSEALDALPTDSVVLYGGLGFGDYPFLKRQDGMWQGGYGAYHSSGNFFNLPGATARVIHIPGETPGL